jgi:hypothetical protein
MVNILAVHIYHIMNCCVGFVPLPFNVTQNMARYYYKIVTMTHRLETTQQDKFQTETPEVYWYYFHHEPL